MKAAKSEIEKELISISKLINHVRLHPLQLPLGSGLCSKRFDEVGGAVSVSRQQSCTEDVAIVHIRWLGVAIFFKAVMLQ